MIFYDHGPFYVKKVVTVKERYLEPARNGYQWETFRRVLVMTLLGGERNSALAAAIRGYALPPIN
jgi:hypothetical protein